MRIAQALYLMKTQLIKRNISKIRAVNDYTLLTLIRPLEEKKQSSGEEQEQAQQKNRSCPQAHCGSSSGSNQDFAPSMEEELEEGDLEN